MSVRILLGDCRERLRDLPDASVDSVVCDPPYHLTSIHKRFAKCGGASRQSPKKSHQYQRLSKGFMGQSWDGGDVAFQPETWLEVQRVLKPGGHLVAFSGTRTYHRMACAIEDAGFEIRDQLAWVYGSGFPKSLDVSKQIDKRKDWEALKRLAEAIKAARTSLGISQTEAARRMGLIGSDDTLGGGGFMWFETGRMPTREEWPRLKSALSIGDEFDEAFAEAEREVVGQHPEGSVPGGFGDHRFSFNSRDITAPATEAAQQWEGWGTALKPAWEPIVLARKALNGTVAGNVVEHGTGALNIDACRIEGEINEGEPYAYKGDNGVAMGAASERLRKNGGGGGAGSPLGRWPANLCHDGSDEVLAGFPDSDGAQGDVRGTEPSGVTNGIYGEFNGRVGQAARNDSGSAARFFYCAKATSEERGEGNNHPTVKPVALMRWLARLVTPKGGTVLDPFTGSGSTALACDAEQFNFIGCELSADYAAIAESRIRNAAGMFADISIEHSGPATRAVA